MNTTLVQPAFLLRRFLATRFPGKATFLLTLASILFIPARADSRPNFVFFLTDDQPYLGMGNTGNTVLKTPAMDALAATGGSFENAFVTTAICCCSRASILTGQYMRRHGIEDFVKPLSAAQLQETYPVLLRKAGYRTGYLGKFGVGSPKVDEKLSLPAELFDLWYGFPQNVAYKQQVDGRDRYLTTIMTEKAVEFFKTQKPDQPFCLTVALKEPHGPLTYWDPEVPKPYTDAKIPRPANLTRESFDALPGLIQHGLNAEPGWIGKDGGYQDFMRRRYAYISRADLAIEQIRAALVAQGLDKNTVIIFMSDNGTFDGAHALSGKWLMHEESIRVPLIICDPRLPASTRGQKRTGMALNIDLAPTMLAMAGVPVPSGMQGLNLQPLLADRNAKIRDDWYYEHLYFDPNRPRIPQSVGVRTERWKYVRYTDASPALEQLFDLVADPHEEHDLAKEPAEGKTLAMLRARCDEYGVSLR